MDDKIVALAFRRVGLGLETEDPAAAAPILKSMRSALVNSGLDGRLEVFRKKAAELRALVGRTGAAPLTATLFEIAKDHGLCRNAADSAAVQQIVNAAITPPIVTEEIKAEKKAEAKPPRDAAKLAPVLKGKTREREAVVEAPVSPAKPTAGKTAENRQTMNGFDRAKTGPGTFPGDIPLDPVDDAADANGKADGSEPTPLYPPLPPAEPYPVHALGPILAAAAAAIASKVQVPVAIAAQSVLAAATLAAQGHANVRLPFGQVRPLSLFWLTIAASGERKTTADHEALWPVRKRESLLRSIHQSETENWKASHSSWHAEKKKLEANSKLDYESRKHALMLLGPEPERPLHPIITAADPTIEGLVKTWVNAPASLGIFTAEGGQFLGGYGMAQDQRLKTAAALSSLWDGGVVKRVRAGDDFIQLPGRRFAMHLMVQLHIAQNFLADPVLRDQGLLSRVLVAAPESIAGTRFYRDPLPQDERAIARYGARLLELLEKPFPLAQGQRNELEPPVIELDPDANQKWRLAYDRIEGRQGPGKDLREIRDFASKAAEQAARMAAVIALVANPDTLTIDGNTMANGIILIDWYLNETARLQQAARTDQRLKIAQELLEWLQARGTETTFRQIYQSGPAAVRTKQIADPVIQVLKDHGWIRQVKARPLTFAVVKV